MKIAAFSKTYEGRTVLDFPGMEVQPGKIYAVIGANGSANDAMSFVEGGSNYVHLEMSGNTPTPPPTSATFFSFSSTKKPFPSGISTFNLVPAPIIFNLCVPSPLI